MFLIWEVGLKTTQRGSPLLRACFSSRLPAAPVENERPPWVPSSAFRVIKLNLWRLVCRKGMFPGRPASGLHHPGRSHRGHLGPPLTQLLPCPLPSAAEFDFTTTRGPEPLLPQASFPPGLPRPRLCLPPRPLTTGLPLGLQLI